MPPSGRSTQPSGCGISKRALAIKPFVVMELKQEASLLESQLRESNKSDAPKLLHLEIGQPSTPPPKPVLDLVATLPRSLGYTEALGRQSLREAISRHYGRWYQIDVPSSCIAVTTGASGALLAGFAACFDPTDRVAVAVPGYPCYRHVLAALSVEVVLIPVDKTTNFQPTLEQLQQSLPLAGVVVASPTNPSGSIIKERDMLELVLFCKQHSARLIVDEIYHGIGELPGTAMAFENVVVISSFSKYWCMTGFRVGWLATRDFALIDAVERCSQNFSVCAPTLSQHAAEKALGSECSAELNAHVSRYRKNQLVLVERLQACGFETTIPDAAFYVWAQCENVCDKIGYKDASELSRALLRETHVAVTPGMDFDPDRGQCFLRFSCAGSEQEIVEAADRIHDFCSIFLWI